MQSAASDPDRYAIVGHPVGHSWSPFIHGMFSKQTGHAVTYRMIDLPPERFRSGAIEFFTTGGKGLNVTIPHKQAAAELVNQLSPAAERAHAVNTICMKGSELVGDNTDGAGLLRDLSQNIGFVLAGKSVLILGAGGATRGILQPLMAANPSVVLIANRTQSKGEALARIFKDLGTVRAVGLDRIPDTAFDLVINATSASLTGDTFPIPKETVSPATLCYDMSYGKGDTPFTAWAKGVGASQAVKGWGMLIEQAAESFQIWRGVRPDTRPVLQALTRL
ncbi:MAG TPA: shikimate dehydrogenase [Steroidobacteraceae bacterium]|nr:shikimate dehydrogenase [Steroidobacteraceae bacterium]